VSTEEHDKLVMSNKHYRELYMKYLGCLRVMADAAVHLDGNESAEEFDMAFNDAQNTFPHLRIKQVLHGRELIILR
jgi:hypothetical protein